MENFTEISINELSTISGGGAGGRVVLGALSGAFEAGQSCILAGPQVYLICAAGGAIVGGLIAYDLRPPRP